MGVGQQQRGAHGRLAELSGERHAQRAQASPRIQDDDFIAAPHLDAGSITPVDDSSGAGGGDGPADSPEPNSRATGRSGGPWLRIHERHDLQ